MISKFGIREKGRGERMLLKKQERKKMPNCQKGLCFTFGNGMRNEII